MNTGDIFQHKTLKDKVIVIANVPVVLGMKDESPNFHEDDYIDITNGDWENVGRLEGF